MPTLDPDDLQPLDADGLAWLVYLVVDPSVESTSHPQGEVVYVGLSITGRDLVEAGDPRSLPDYEVPARQRLHEIIDKGRTPLIEVLADRLPPEGREDRATAMRDALVQGLWPRPLNAVQEPDAVIRLPEQVLSASLSARPVTLPDHFGVMYSLIESPGPFGDVASVLATSPDRLAWEFSRQQSPIPVEVLNRHAEDPGLIWLIAAGPRLATGLVRPGLVLGAYLIERAEQDPEVLQHVTLHVSTDERGMALQRLLTGSAIPVGFSTPSEPLRWLREPS